MSDAKGDEPIEVESAIDTAAHRQALAAALLGLSSNPNDSERQRLHDLLDQVLNLRAQYESLPRGLNALQRLMTGEFPDPEESRLSQAAFKTAVELFVRSLGAIRTVMLPPLGVTPSSARLTLQYWLLRLGTILRHPGFFGGPPSITLDQVIEELEDLDFGDQGTIFCPTQRKGGQRRSQGKLARLRLKALAWERYLRSQGGRPGDAQTKVSGAFGESWTTISKWKIRVSPLLGEWRVNYALNAAEGGQQPTYNFLTTTDEQLLADGHQYRATLRESKNRTS